MDNRIKNIPTKFYKSKYLDAFKKKIFEQEYEIDLPFLPNDQKLELFSSMFHIAVENISEKNYFTEKLVDCFRTFTIPIYHGCPNIGDYFDTDGMLQFTSPEELVEKLNNLTADSYYEKLDVIRQNYQKALPYFDPWARLATNIIEFKKTTHK